MFRLRGLSLSFKFFNREVIELIKNFVSIIGNDRTSYLLLFI